MKAILSIIFSLAVSGCATVAPGWPGNTKISESKVDGKRTIYMNPAWLSGSRVRISLVATSIDPNRILLTAMAPGLNKIPQKSSLVFKVDGEIFKLSATSRKTEYSTTSGSSYAGASNWSGKNYVVKESFLKKLVNAKEVHCKFYFAEGEFSINSPTTAKPGVKGFLRKYAEFKKGLPARKVSSSPN